MRFQRFLGPLVIFLGLLTLLGAALGRNPQDIPSPLVGQPAPAVRLPVLDSADKVFTPADLRGQVWVLNVWASWCVACRVEHPLWLDLARRSPVPLVGLNYMDSREAGLKWLARHGNPYRQVALDVDGKAGIDFGVYGVPETFVIDKRGVVRLKLAGPITPEFVEQKLLPLLAELGRA